MSQPKAFKNDSIQIKLAIASGVIRQKSDNFVKILGVQQEMSNELMTKNREDINTLGGVTLLHISNYAAASNLGITFLKEMARQIDKQAEGLFDKNSKLAKIQDTTNKASYNKTNETAISSPRRKP